MEDMICSQSRKVTNLNKFSKTPILSKVSERALTFLNHRVLISKLAKIKLKL